MIAGIGIDVIEVHRVEQELSRGAWSASDGVFTENEIRQCNAASSPAQLYAACFAGKEATLKALGIAPGDLAFFREIELDFSNGNEPAVDLHGRTKQESEHLGVRRIRLSITRSERLASALVLLDS